MPSSDEERIDLIISKIIELIDEDKELKHKIFKKILYDNNIFHDGIYETLEFDKLSDEDFKMIISSMKLDATRHRCPWWDAELIIVYKNNSDKLEMFCEPWIKECYN